MRSFLSKVFLVCTIFFVVKNDETSCDLSMVKQPAQEGVENQTLFSVTLKCNESSKSINCDSSKQPQFKVFLYKKEAKQPEGPRIVDDESAKTLKENVEKGIQKDLGLPQQEEREVQQQTVIQQENIQQENIQEGLVTKGNLEQDLKKRRMLFSYNEEKMKFDTYDLADGYSHQFILENYTFHEIQDAEACSFLIHGVGIRVFSLFLISLFTFGL